VASGITNGSGIFAGNTKGLTVTGNSFTGNSVGITLYASSEDMTGVTISNNILSGNSQFGVRTSMDSPGLIDNPVFSQNDFSNSGSYALYLQAQNLELDTANTFTGSANGIYIQGGSFNIHDLDLSNSGVLGTEIYAVQASSVTLTNMNLSTNLASNGSRMGFNSYRVAAFNFTNVNTTNQDTGIEFATDSGIVPTGSVTNSTFSNNSFAGIYFVSFDSTTLGPITLTSNTINESNTRGVYVAPGTTANIIQTLRLK
jgi:parallel beta-helix repeat protein